MSDVAAAASCGGPHWSVVPADGYFLAADSSFSLVLTPPNSVDLVTPLNFENENTTHLLVSGFTGADGDDLDSNAGLHS